jgi:hypothetical protein
MPHAGQNNPQTAANFLSGPWGCLFFMMCPPIVTTKRQNYLPNPSLERRG